MSPSQKKRASAFDDFPEPQAPAAAEGQPASRPARPAAAPSEPQVERIERLKPSQMIPDRFQPRRLLPGTLRAAFFGRQIDCYRAATEWLALAQKEPGYQAEIERLLAMGDSFTEHGQIKPITGSWQMLSDGSPIFLIETGERRFWAACLQAVKERRKEEPLLRVEVVSRPTRQRQVLENRHAELPSAVGQACEVASLILAELGIQPDSGGRDDFDYFRQARAQRMPAGLWERISPIMQLTRPRMVQLLNILQLPTPLLELADRHRLAERVLREVLALPPVQWEKVLRASIQNQLTSEDVAEIARPEPRQPGPSRLPRRAPFEPGKTALSGLRRFASIITELEDEASQAEALDEAADILVSTGEADGMLNLLGELARSIEMRLTRK